MDIAGVDDDNVEQLDIVYGELGESAELKSEIVLEADSVFDVLDTVTVVGIALGVAEWESERAREEFGEAANELQGASEELKDASEELEEEPSEAVEPEDTEIVKGPIELDEVWEVLIAISEELKEAAEVPEEVESKKALEKLDDIANELDDV